MKPIEEVWQCQTCLRLHETDWAAEHCCPPDLMWQCAECKEAYFDSDLAEECCTDPEDED